MKSLKLMSCRTYLKMTFLKKILIVSLSVFLLSSVGNIGIYRVEASSTPIDIVHSIPITLTNTQTVATPAPFQQMITVDSAEYSSYEATNLQNIEFFDASGSPIPSWLESGNSNTSTNTIYWLKLVNGIPANSSVTVNMGFASPNTNLLSTQTTGEAPQLSSTYGEYDNGANIFIHYDNFEGNSLNGNWVNCQMSAIVNNGVTLSTSYNGTSTWGHAGIIYNTNLYGNNCVVESCGSETSNGNSNLMFLLNQNSTSVVPYNFLGGMTGQNNTTNVWHDSQNPSGTINGTYFATVASVKNYIWSEFVNGSSLFGEINYGAVATSSVSTDYNPPKQYSAIGGWGSLSIHLQWFRVRAYPPNGIMPGVNITAHLSPTPTQAGSSSTPATSKLSSFIIIIIAVIALVVIVGVLALFLVQKETEERPRCY